MTKVDIAVVGAGIVGCMIASEITSRSPGTSVVVLDRDMIGSGASRRSAGLHFPRGATERVRAMTAYSQDYYERLRAEQPTLPIHPLGMSVIARTAGEARLHEIYLDRAKLTRVDDVPGDLVRVPDDAGVWDGDGCQYADVPALAAAVARGLRPRVNIREGVRVTAVEPVDGGVRLRLGTAETVTVGRVVLAPGPWLHAPAWHSLVAPLGIRIKKVVAMHVERAPSPDDRAIVFHDEDAFLLPVAERGHWLFSHTCQEWDVAPDALVEGLSAADMDEARTCLSRYAPQLAKDCTAGRVFCDAYSTNGEPQVRALDETGRIVFAGAANGSGYRLAPAIAAQAVDLLQIPGARSHA